MYDLFQIDFTNCLEGNKGLGIDRDIKAKKLV